MDAFERLKQLKALYDQDVITDQEYEKLKVSLLKEIEEAHSSQHEKSQNVVGAVQTNAVTPQSTSAVSVQPGVISHEGATTGMKVLSFLIPIVGLILFLVNQNTKPVEAKDELKWAAIGFGIECVSYIIIVAAATSAYY